MGKKVQERILYKDEKIQINSSDRGEESHDVWVGDTEKPKDDRRYFFLDRGILRDFAENIPPEHAIQSLNAFNRNIPEYLRETEISPTYFALACARARIREERDFAEDLMRTRRR